MTGEKLENRKMICGAFLYKGVRLFLHRKYIDSYSGQHRSLNKAVRASLLLVLPNVHTLIVVRKESDLLVLLVVVDLVVPEEGLTTVSAGRTCLMILQSRRLKGLTLSPSPQK